MGIYNYQDLTPPEFESINKDRSVVFINLDPMENHGPHLPLGTDMHQSVWFTKKISETLQSSHPDWNFIAMPAICAGSDTIIHKGSIEISPRTLRAILFETCAGLAKQGFKKIIVLSAHGGPRHLVVCEEVSAKLKWRHRATLLSAPSRIILTILSGKFRSQIEEKLKFGGYTLTSEELAGFIHDYHGGLMETSMMLTVRHDLVKPVFRTLRPAIVDKIWKVNRKAGIRAGDGLGYVGSPSFARPEIGKAIVDVVLEDLIPLFERMMKGIDVRKEFRSKLYFIPHFRTDFKMALFVGMYAALFGAAWIYIVRLTSETLK